MSTNMDLLGLDGLEGFDDETLPVVSISASQSLNASAATRDSIATGLARLDEALNDLPDQPNQGGILRGHVTEIFGPPGAGKTSLALNITCNALRGGKVVWIDTGCPLPSPRLEEMSVNLDDFVYFRAHTLPHLIALLARPPKGFPPSETHLIVVDSVSNLFPAYFPSAQELKDQLTEGKITDKSHLQWLLNRKWNVASQLATHLAKLAARNIAVLAINQSHTKIKGQSHAALQPLLSGSAWEASVQTRIAVYRDLPDERVVEVEKRAGKPLPEQAEGLLVAFRIEPDGLCEIERNESLPSDPLTPLLKSPPDFEYYDPPTPTPSPISSVLSSAPPSSEIEPHKLSPSRPASPEQPVQTPNKKRKVEEVADSQDEDSENDVPWTGETTLNTT
ncbi:uncharacterized protein N7500_010625 [Penicillium coprophilum]|uniref:uncharacterized protein n=1 Tax=Penicillium coprophilum TaxID=36646 RepID=UPI00238D8E24|nr:uncharacterized protein N7500_010625 [Penicillium coprophilum]KAJ5150436.1 hypothetical protein N7500_010625 [Penicillium coprophilum]